jgi:hypothetical protein
MSSATMPTTLATGMRKPRRQGTPPICRGSTVMRVKLMGGSSQRRAAGRSTSGLRDREVGLTFSEGEPRTNPGPSKARPDRRGRGAGARPAGQGLFSHHPSCSPRSSPMLRLPSRAWHPPPDLEPASWPRRRVVVDLGCERAGRPHRLVGGLGGGHTQGSERGREPRRRSPRSPPALREDWWGGTRSEGGRAIHRRGA